MQSDKLGRDPSAEMSDRALWGRAVMTAGVEEDSERYLDLAGFADGLLDPDERERVAERLAADPDAAADVAAARALSAAEMQLQAPAAVVERARALVGRPAAAQGGNVIPLRPGRTLPLMARWTAQWASLAAAVVLAGWLGFTLGMDISGALASRNGDDLFLDDLIELPGGFIPGFTEGART